MSQILTLIRVWTSDFAKLELGVYNNLMRDIILNFPKQFAFEPEIENSENLKKAGKFIVVGMGGSALAAGLLKIYTSTRSTSRSALSDERSDESKGKPHLDLRIHRNYGLPEMPEAELKERMTILSSHSGNTEEVIDAYRKARELNLAMAAIGTGGELLKLAKEDSIPYIQIPDTGIEPRLAVGFAFKALLKIIGDEDGIKESENLTSLIKSNEYETKGKELAEKLKNFVPIIYSSQANIELAYNWKIKFNETAKIPAFSNRLPELNHNEMTGFDVHDSTQNLSEKFYFIFLKDAADHPKIIKRMEILEKMYKERGLKVESEELEGKSVLEKIFNSSILADWTAYYLAQSYGVEPSKTPMVEEFKKMIST